jgi:hypothetical protein
MIIVTIDRLSHMRFQVLKASVTFMILNDVLEVITASIIRTTHRPDDNGSTKLRNMCQHLPDYSVQHPRRQKSSYLPYISISDFPLMLKISNAI